MKQPIQIHISGYVIVVPDGRGGIKAVVSPWGGPHIYGFRQQARRDLATTRYKHPTAIIKKLSGFVSLTHQ